MITPFETHFVYQAGRPRGRAELVAGFARGCAVLAAAGRCLGRLRRPQPAGEGERAVA
jgi:hypothetical protein